MSLAFALGHRADVDPHCDAVTGGSPSLTNEQVLRRVRAAATGAGERVMLDHAGVDAMVATDRVDARSLLDVLERVRREH